jgi:hypothetical protein
MVFIKCFFKPNSHTDFPPTFPGHNLECGYVYADYFVWDEWLYTEEDYCVSDE